MNIKLKDAVEYFIDNWDIMAVFVNPRGDYAVPVFGKKDLFLVVEKNGKGIFLASLPPDLMDLRRLSEEASDEVRQYIYRRLKEANLA